MPFKQTKYDEKQNKKTYFFNIWLQLSAVSEVHFRPAQASRSSHSSSAKEFCVSKYGPRLTTIIKAVQKNSMFVSVNLNETFCKHKRHKCWSHRAIIALHCLTFSSSLVLFVEYNLYLVCELYFFRMQLVSFVWIVLFVNTIPDEYKKDPHHRWWVDICVRSKREHILKNCV